MANDLSPTDESVLSFAAAHELVLASQVRRVVGEDPAAALARVERLCDEGLLARGPRFSFQWGGFQITRWGLDRLGSDLPAPGRVDLRRYWRDLGLGWLWVHASRGEFGETDAIFSRRVMRVADEGVDVPSRVDMLSPELMDRVTDARFAMGMGGDRVRYPGLVVVLPEGRFAFELVLSDPSEIWVDEVLSAYAAKPQVRAAVLLSNRQTIVDGLRSEIERRGMDDRVQAQFSRFVFDSA